MAKLKSTTELFKGRHFEQSIILCVRWYLRYNGSSIIIFDENGGDAQLARVSPFFINNL